MKIQSTCESRLPNCTHHLQHRIRNFPNEIIHLNNFKLKPDYDEMRKREKRRYKGTHLTLGREPSKLIEISSEQLHFHIDFSCMCLYIEFTHPQRENQSLLFYVSYIIGSFFSFEYRFWLHNSLSHFRKKQSNWYNGVRLKRFWCTLSLLSMRPDLMEEVRWRSLEFCLLSTITNYWEHVFETLRYFWQCPK
jgi:hypothetical protein